MGTGRASASCWGPQLVPCGDLLFRVRNLWTGITAAPMSTTSPATRTQFYGLAILRTNVTTSPRKANDMVMNHTAVILRSFHASIWRSNHLTSGKKTRWARSCHAHPVSYALFGTALPPSPSTQYLLSSVLINVVSHHLLHSGTHFAARSIDRMADLLMLSAYCADWPGVHVPDDAFNYRAQIRQVRHLSYLLMGFCFHRHLLIRWPTQKLAGLWQ